MNADVMTIVAEYLGWSAAAAAMFRALNLTPNSRLGKQLVELSPLSRRNMLRSAAANGYIEVLQHARKLDLTAHINKILLKANSRAVIDVLISRLGDEFVLYKVLSCADHNAQKIATYVGKHDKLVVIDALTNIYYEKQRKRKDKSGLVDTLNMLCSNLDGATILAAAQYFYNSSILWGRPKEEIVMPNGVTERDLSALSWAAMNRNGFFDSNQ